MKNDFFHLEINESESRPFKGLASGYSICFKFEDELMSRKVGNLKPKFGDLDIHNNIFILPSSKNREDFASWNVLSVKARALEDCAVEYRLNLDELRKALRERKKVKKSIWIDQLLHRLVFEVMICKHTTSRAATFCVLELVKEVYYSNSSADDKLVFNADGADIRLQKALKVIEAELDFLWTADKLGKKVGTSASTLGRLFKNEFGISTMEFIWDLRLRKAFALLNHTSMAIGEIAFAVGFESMTGFSTSFKRKFGCSPKSLKLKINA